MTSRAEFSEDEWELLRAAPSSAGMIVITAARGGQLRESVEMAKAYADARKDHGDSELLDEIAAAAPKVDSKRYKSREERKQHGLQQLHEAAELLRRKATAQDTDAYKAFVNGLSKRAAGAAKGGVLGLSGKRVSDAEQSVLEEIAYALDSGGRWSSTFDDPAPDTSD